jgi:glycosyltransferase involved in cell wall biosynthesis
MARPFGRRARAIFLFDTLELGGAERQGLLLATHLRDHCEVEVEVWGLTGAAGQLARMCDDRGLRWRAVGLAWRTRVAEWPGNLLALHRLARDLRAARPDLILPYTYFSNVIAGLVWRRTGARVCVWNQRDAGLYLEGFDPWRSAATRLVSGFVANSQAGAAAVRALTGKPVTLVPNGVELAAPRDDRATWRARLGVAQDGFVATMVANLHAHKDHATLLHAWRELVGGASPPRAVLALAGRSEETGAAVRQLADELGIAPSVRFLGAIDDVSGLYAASDLYVHSSTSEGLPNAVLEAMAAGLPVVATDLPGIREAVGPGGLAQLVPPNAPARLAQQLARLFADPGLRGELGKSAARRIHDELSATRMCETMVRYLTSLWNRHA